MNPEPPKGYRLLTEEEKTKPLPTDAKTPNHDGAWLLSIYRGRLLPNEPRIRAFPYAVPATFDPTPEQASAGQATLEREQSNHDFTVDRYAEVLSERDTLRAENARLAEENARLAKALEDNAGTVGKSLIITGMLGFDASATAEQVIEGVARLTADLAAAKSDGVLIDVIESRCLTVRMAGASIADTGDYSNWWEVIEHYMAKPNDRVIATAPEGKLRQALRAAITAAQEETK